MEKVVRDGKVAILYAPRDGAGWYTCNSDKRCLFHPKLVELVEKELAHTIDEDLMYTLLGDGQYRNEFHFYCGGASDLEIIWLPEGTNFTIEAYDGLESIRTFEDIQLIA